MEEKAVAIREEKQVAIQELETRFAMAVRQRELLENYIKERLKPDKHFYTVSEGQKPSLTKEGAELISLPHALKPRYQILSGPEQPPPDNSPYQLTVKCELEAPGGFAGEGIGSASSYLTKKTGEYKPRQNDPGLCHNATLKMAQKSSYIAATLNSTAASEFFTQDLEDDQAGGHPKPEPKEHFCSEHGEVWKEMKNSKTGQTFYAHKTKVTEKYPKGWCNQPQAPQQEPQEEPPPEDVYSGQPYNPDVDVTLEELLKADDYKKFKAICKKMGYTSQTQIFSVMESKDLPDIESKMTLEEALDKLGTLQGKDWRSL